jgi:hypothetical protein
MTFCIEHLGEGVWVSPSAIHEAAKTNPKSPIVIETFMYRARRRRINFCLHSSPQEAVLALNTPNFR